MYANVKFILSEDVAMYTNVKVILHEDVDQHYELLKKSFNRRTDALMILGGLEF